MHNALYETDIYQIETPNSSNIARYKYFVESKKLVVEFKRSSGNSNKYEYENVPSSIFEGMVQAESVGKFFAQHIKSQYVFKKLEP